MNKAKLFCLILIVFVVAFCAGACGDDDESENAEEVDSDTQESESCNGEVCSEQASCQTVAEEEQCVCDDKFIGNGKICDPDDDWLRHKIGDQDYAIYVTTGDVDGDGKSDMLVTSSDHTATYPSEIAWYKNPGQGGDWAKHVIASSTGEDPVMATNGIVFGDINKDGANDIVVATGPAPTSSEATGGLYLFTAGADPTAEWERKDLFETKGEAFFKVYILDVNRDDAEDVVAGGTNAGLIALNPGTADGEWKIERMNDGTGGGLYVADIDNDSAMEVISANTYAKKIIATHITADQNTISYKDVVVADLEWVLDVNTVDVNGDGYQDILASRIAGPGLRWFENPTDGSANWTERIIDKDLYCTDIYVGDLNGDKKDDVLVAGLAIMASDTPPMSIVWFEIDGQGENITWRKHYVDYDKPDLTAPGDVELVDFNGDGKLDIATTSMLDHFVYWYQNALY